MSPRWTLAAAVLLAGCAAVEEAPPPVEAAAEAPQVAIVKPAPPEKAAVPAPPADVAPPTVPERPRASETETLISEFARMRRLSGAELAREQEAARNAFNQTRSDSARVRLAMTLAIHGSPGSDDAQALALLDPLVKTPGASLHALAFLLAAHIQDQRRLTAQVSGLQQNVQGLQQNVQGLQQNVQGLQQKLDAIKSLERSLSGREATRRK
jgi:hypothetical protein